MEKKEKLFTPSFIGNLFLKGKVNRYVGDDGFLHEGYTLVLIGIGLIVMGILIKVIAWILKKIRH